MSSRSAVNKTLSSFYETQSISYELLPNFSLASIPIDLQKFSNDVTKKITIKCIKLSFNKSDSIKFICGKSNKNSSRKDLLEWIKDEEIAKLIEKYEFKLGVYEIFFKKSNEDKNSKEESFTKEDIEDIKELAEFGVTSTQLILGLLYAKCIQSAEVELDDNKALEWFKKCSEQGLVEGNLCLGYIYSKEKSSTYNPQEALTYFAKAAEENGVAMRNLAIMHLVGEQTPQNIKDSIKLFRKAYNQCGDAVSGNILGILYQNGVGVSKDAYEAAKYYRKASDLGDVNAKFNLGLLYLSGENIKKDEAEAVKLFKEASEKGFTRAQMFLANAYEHGQGIEKNEEKAFEWYSKVAENEGAESIISYIADSQFCLAKLCEKGFNTKEKDLEKALYWYTKSAENGNLMAQVTLGDMYRNGRGVEEIDEKKALSWYIKAARHDHYQAQFSLGELYEKGLLGVKKDEDKALQWYKKSARQGYIMALLRLGIGSESGEYIQRKIEMITKLPPVKESENDDKALQPPMVEGNDEFFDKLNNLKDGETLEISESDEANGLFKSIN
jgi:TPR repeat protein